MNTTTNDDFQFTPSVSVKGNRLHWAADADLTTTVCGVPVDWTLDKMFAGPHGTFRRTADCRNCNHKVLGTRRTR
jgi:hypothetical protein